MVRKDIIDIVSDMGALFEEVGITTNGTVLNRKLPRMKEAGLTHLNVSLDSLIPSKNEFITRRPDSSKQVLKAIDTAFNIGMKSVKLNVVAMNNFNCDEFVQFAELTKELPLDVRFIEFMPFDQNDWNNKKFISMTEIHDRIKQAYPEIARIQNESVSSTSKGYKIPNF